jgi:general secretion pathway protein G
MNRIRRRRAARGFTLIEVLVVLGIIALLSGVVAIAVIKHFEHARIETTHQSALTLRNAAMTYRMTHTDDECPTLEKLVADDAIDQASKAKDAWDRSFEISCDEHGIHVASAGPDKKPGTPDDIHVP